MNTRHFLAGLAGLLWGLWSASIQAVGFQRLSIAGSNGTTMAAAVWYPSQDATAMVSMGPISQEVAVAGAITGTSLPLVVISHGTGGSFLGHHDTAIALAQAGFVVAAVSHPGDNYADQREAIAIMNRPRHIIQLIDHMLTAWPSHARIDASRVGIFGFSAGGFTALVNIGGKPDLAAVAPHCVEHPKEFVCVLRAKHASPRPSVPPLPESSLKDGRIRAAVVVAPALGFAFGRSELADVSVPIQLWRAEDDTVQPHPRYAEAVRNALPGAPEYHVVARAGHFDFLAPCNAQFAAIAPTICVSAKGFDRSSFHATFNAAVVIFFSNTLRARDQTPNSRLPSYP